MDITSVTVGLPVTDIEASCLWYGAVFERTEPDLEPEDGVAEYEVGGIWIQLYVDEPPRRTRSASGSASTTSPHSTPASARSASTSAPSSASTGP